MSGKILVVDDDIDVRSGLQLLLRRQEYEVRTASDGNGALDVCASFDPDLILLDVMMPGRDGFEVCHEIKSRPETRLIPVILVTGLSDKSHRIRGIEAGADDFLNKPIDMTELDARVRSLLRLKSFTDELENAEAVLFSLALAIEARDPYTHGHCARLSEFSAHLGERIGLPDDDITALRRAGIVHDIGKVVVPDAILLKPGPLTADERATIRKHPAVGERICSPLKSFRTVLGIIRHHHERWDGSGYPDGLRSGAIPLTARVLQIADVYDALTTHRAYRAALAPNDAWKILEEEVDRGWWDGNLVREFREMMKNGSVGAANGNRKRGKANTLANAASSSSTK